MQAQVFVRRSSGELEGGWYAQPPRDVNGVEYIRVRRPLSGLLFVEKDVLPEALAMWQEEAAQGADVLPLDEAPLLPTVDRIDLWDGIDELLGGA